MKKHRNNKVTEYEIFTIFTWNQRHTFNKLNLSFSDARWLCVNEGTMTEEIWS